jgi:integrase/recombinase XerD
MAVQVLRDSDSSSLHHLVDEFFISCRARGLSPATLHRGYGHPLRRVFLPWCDANDIHSVDQLDQRVLDRFTAHLLDDGGTLGRPLSRYSVHSYARTVSQFLRWCKEQGEIVAGKPQLPSRPRRVLDVLTRQEIDAMEMAVPTERDKLIIRLLADTGMRVGELCGLCPDDIKPDGRRAYLKVRGKGAQERLVPLSPALARRIDRHIRSRPKDAGSPNLFLALRRASGGDFEGLTTSGVLDLVHSAADRAGITKRVYPHLFRHSFATEALRRGMDPITTAKILGHNSLRMIERTYSHLTVRDSYDAMLAMLTSDR